MTSPARVLVVLTASIVFCGVMAFDARTGWARPQKKKARRAAAAQRLEAKSKVPATKAEQVERELDAKLAKTLPQIEIDQKPFEDVVEMLSKETSVDLMIDKKTLEDEGIDTAEPISFSAKNPITAADVLSSVLEPLQLTYHYKRGAVEITTATAAGNYLETRTYDIRDLQRFSAPAKEQGIGGGFGGGFFNATTQAATRGQPEPAPADAHIPPVKSGAAIIEVLTSTIDPDTWSEVGGAGTIQEFDGVLVIRQTQAVHRETRRILAEIRQTLKTP